MPVDFITLSVISAFITSISVFYGLYVRSRLLAQRRAIADQEMKIALLSEKLLSAEIRLGDREEGINLLRSELVQKQREYDVIQDAKHKMENHLVAANVRSQEREAGFELQKQQFEASRLQLTSEFQNLASEILEQKTQSFNETNKQSMDNLLQPFKSQMEQFRLKVEDIHHKETQQRTELKTEMVHLKELNQKITQEAHELATALKGQKKMQGNWGELILDNVLERSGLREGIDYKKQMTVRSESGAVQYPDVVVFLPQNKHLIVDSKVSLNAYTRYVNAQNEAERQVALTEHSQAFSARIKELADKDYAKASGLNSPEMVFMFVPIESAFVDALKDDESIFQDAIEKNILVATPTTLLTSLNIVRQLWRFEEQSKHTAELVKRADSVYKKLRTFVSSFQGIKKSLDRASEEYEKAENQLVSGKGNLIKRAEEFKTFAPSIQGSLPPELVEKAALEIDFQPAEFTEENTIDSKNI